jgi:hypothetical protein
LKGWKVVHIFTAQSATIPGVGPVAFQKTALFMQFKTIGRGVVKMRMVRTPFYAITSKTF